MYVADLWNGLRLFRAWLFAGAARCFLWRFRDQPQLLMPWFLHRLTGTLDTPSKQFRYYLL